MKASVIKKALAEGGFPVHDYRRIGIAGSCVQFWQCDEAAYYLQERFGGTVSIDEILKYAYWSPEDKKIEF